MNVVNDLFFELLQVAIGNRQSLSRVPTPEEWEEIYEMSKKQSLAGIAFAGVERLPQEQMPPGKRIRQWAVKAEKIREHNAKVSEDCRVISRFFEENGFDCVILKGQGNFAYYPEWLQGLRSAGDIDVWCWPKGKKNGNVNGNGKTTDGSDGHGYNKDNKDNETQSEIATIREHGSLRYGASAYENGSNNKDNRDNKDNIILLNSLNQRAIASDLNSLNSEASAEVLNQREARLEHPVRAVIEFCLSKKRGEYVYYHNLDFPVLKATPVEVHYRPTWLYNPFRNRVLQRWFASQVQEGSSASQVQEVQRVQERAREFKVYDGYKIPSVEFNVVFQLLHLYKHIFEEGIGLRQLLDYYFVVQNINDNDTQSEIATKTKRPSDYENGSNNKDNRDNKDNIILLNSLNQRAIASDLNSEASAEVLNQRGARFEPAQRLNLLNQRAEASDLNLLNQCSDLNSLNSEASAEVLNQRGARLELFKKLGLKEFAGAVMYVLREVFAMPEERMLCRPDEKRGRKLLEEIMIGGNFGKFDERYNWAETTSGSMDYRGASYAVARLRHNFQFLKDYPSEVLWEPVFRVYHWVWRKFQLWRFE